MVNNQSNTMNISTSLSYNIIQNYFINNYQTLNVQINSFQDVITSFVPHPTPTQAILVRSSN
ncbi:MAG: hypothetical protein RLZZ408_972 [Verrucomicrobiota bacterium]|jgi:hypothetical protein